MREAIERLAARYGQVLTVYQRAGAHGPGLFAAGSVPG